MAQILPIVLPASLLTEYNIDPANDFSHSVLDFCPTSDGGLLLTEIFYNYFRYDKTDDRDLSHLFLLELSSDFTIVRVEALRRVTQRIFEAPGLEYHHPDVSLSLSPDGEVYIGTLMNRLFRLEGVGDSIAAELDRLRGDPSACSSAAWFPGGDRLTVRSGNLVYRRSSLPESQPPGTLGSFTDPGTPWARAFPGSTEDYWLYSQNEDPDFPDLAPLVGSRSEVQHCRVSCLDDHRVLLTALTSHKSDLEPWPHYHLLDGSGQLIGTIPTQPRKVALGSPWSGRPNTYPHSRLNGWVQHEGHRFSYFDQDGTLIVDFALSDELKALDSLSLVGVGHQGQLVFVHRKHFTLLASTPVHASTDIEPALVEIAICYRRGVNQLKKQVPLAGKRFIADSAEGATLAPPKSRARRR